MKPTATLPKTATVVASTLILTGCDPMLSLQGSFWPAWIVCILAGLAASMLLSGN